MKAIVLAFILALFLPLMSGCYIEPDLHIGIIGPIHHGHGHGHGRGHGRGHGKGHHRRHH